MKIRYSWTTRNTDKTPPAITPIGAWTPDRMVNIIAWFDPANRVTQSSGSVSDWGDVFGWDATQPTAGTRLVWSSTQVNGFPGFTNNGTFTGFLTVPNLAANVPRTVVTLASAPSAATNNTLVAGGTGSFEARVGSSNFPVVIQTNTAVLGTATVACDATALGLIVWSADTGNYAFRVNGTAAGSGTFTASGIGGSALTIGGSSADGTYWAGSFGDVILTGDYNNTSEIQKAEGYLAWKYSLSSLLPVGHPYKSAAP